MATYTPSELEALVRQRAPEIARDIQAAVGRARVEADLVAEVEKVLERFTKSFDVTVHLERERTLVNGRADAVYNRFVVEYEPPRSLRPNNENAANKHAVDQVQDYLMGLERLERHRRERLAGVVLDGSYYIFVRYRDERWRVDDPLPVDAQSTETFLHYLLALSTELALTPENLMRDFGENSNVARQVVPALYGALISTENPKVRTLFRQWQRQFHEVTGYDAVAGGLEAAELARQFAVKEKQPDLERLFFSVHTYYAIFIKLLALQVAHYYLMPKVGTGLAAVASLPGDELAKYLRDMERGGIFAELGIRNFLEGDFFGWHLDIWDDGLDRALRRLIGDLANYSLVTLDVDPDDTRDLLKRLYQNLMPKKLRHALGEYYTPDWLAERLLNQLGFEGDHKERLLDPACGSGTFLVLAIKRVRRYAQEKLLPEGRVLEQVLQNVVGFDLNPLAVISARTNYLLALGDLLPHRQGEISVPVYLADSILTPSESSGDLFTRGGFSFNTAVGRFTLPRSLVAAGYIDQLASLLEDSVLSGLKPEQFRQRLLTAFPLDTQRDEDDMRLMLALYEQLQDLERQGIDGIWARIIKNAFAPLFQGRFDYVAGNPPWVNWESLPGDYRQDTADLWRCYGMAATKGKGSQQFELGKQKRDLCALMTYVAADKYLQREGKLGFLVTQSLLKNVGAEGFRTFQLPDASSLRVISADDLVDPQPFEGANNRTAVIVMQRGQRTRYPVAYNFWRKTTRGKRISEVLTLAEALAMCSVRQHIAEPVDRNDMSSPWITGRRRALSAVRRTLGRSDYEAHQGCNTLGANGILWVEVLAKPSADYSVVSNLAELGQRRVESVQATVESDLVYPLIRSSDVRRWRAIPSSHLILPHTPTTSWQAIPEDQMKRVYPKAYAYLLRFHEPLVERRGYHLLRSGHPFYILGDIHTETFAPYKVVWQRMGSAMSAAVVSPNDMRPTIPQETVVLVPLESEGEAYFICAVVNSSPFNFAVQSFSQRGGKSFGTPSILHTVRVPRFDAAQGLHRRLADLSGQAHAATAAENSKQVREIETAMDEAAAELWGLSAAELKEIQESLAELA